MPHHLPIRWKAGTDDGLAEVVEFVAEPEAGEIRVRGRLSTGTRGWVLKAEAGCRRAVVTLQVTAVERGEIRHPDLEFHHYEARIRVRRTGRYHLRVLHSYIPRGEPGDGYARPVFEGTVTVPPVLP